MNVYELDEARTLGEWSNVGLNGNGVVFSPDDARLAGFASEADGAYVAASTHPETGWAATQRELDRYKAALEKLALAPMCSDEYTLCPMFHTPDCPVPVIEEVRCG